MISVIIPVYNVEKYLEQCLQSIINQSYKDLEIIIINDGSKDRCEDIIQKYRSQYFNIIYIKQENRGISEARNQGLKYATGDYIVFIDSDDYIEPSYISDMYEIAEQKQCDIVICGYKEFYDTGNSKDIEFLHNLEEDTLYSGKEIAEMMLLLKVKGYPWNKLFRNSDIFRKNMIFEKNRKVEDYFPIFKVINESNEIYFINKSLYNYRQRDGSLVNIIDTKLVDDFHYACDSIIKYSIKNNLDKTKINYFKSNCFNLTMINYIFLNIEKGWNIYKEFESKGYNSYAPSIIEIITNNCFNYKTKILIILFKMRILHILLKIKGVG